MAEPRGQRRVLMATNKHLAKLPEELRDDALCEIARELARQVDAGQVSAATQLTKVLDALRKLAAPARPTARVAAEPDEPEEDPPDELDELERARAHRLAGAQGVVRSLGADQRRPGGRASG